MLPVFLLLLSAYLPGRIKAAVKHPMLTATKTWALAHLLANGMLADVLLLADSWPGPCSIASRSASVPSDSRARPREIQRRDRGRRRPAALRTLRRLGPRQLVGVPLMP